MTTGNKFRTIRRFLGMPTRTLARRAGLHYGQVVEWEKNELPLGPSQISSIERVLDAALRVRLQNQELREFLLQKIEQALKPEAPPSEAIAK